MLLGLIGILSGMKAVKIVVAGRFKLFPDFVRKFTGNMPDLLPLLLNTASSRGLLPPRLHYL